jgi:hypothetical protein
LQAMFGLELKYLAKIGQMELGIELLRHS